MGCLFKINVYTDCLFKINVYIGLLKINAYMGCLFKINAYIGRLFKINAYIENGCLFQIITTETFTLQWCITHLKGIFDIYINHVYTDCLYKINVYIGCLFKINAYMGCLFEINAYIGRLFKKNAYIENGSLFQINISDIFTTQGCICHLKCTFDIYIVDVAIYIFCH